MPVLFSGRLTLPVHISRGGVEGLRLLVGILLQNEGCHHWWQPSPMSALDKHVCTKWWSSFGVSWGSHQAIAVIEAWSSIFAHTCNMFSCSHLAWLRPLRVSPCVDTENTRRHNRIGPHWFLVLHWLRFTSTLSWCICLCRRDPLRAYQRFITNLYMCYIFLYV